MCWAWPVRWRCVSADERRAPPPATKTHVLVRCHHPSEPHRGTLCPPLVCGAPAVLPIGGVRPLRVKPAKL